MRKPGLADIGLPVSEHGQTGILRDIATLLIAAEELHHQHGWDETPPHLYQVCHGVHGSGYDAYSAPLGFQGVRPAVELMGLAVALRDLPFGREIMGMNGNHPPVAHFVVMEAWSRVENAEEYAAATAAPSALGIADLPGSVEMRCAYAVAGKYLLMVNRQRGHDPLFSREDLAGASRWTGAMLTALCAFDSAARAAYTAVH